MVRTLLGLIVVFCLAQPAWAAEHCPAKTAAEHCPAKTRAEMINFLLQGIALNERFKQSPDAGLRQKLEIYEEQTQVPCLKKAGRRLSNGDDPGLLQVFFTALISAENSADEEYSDTLARLWAARPERVEAAIAATPEVTREGLEKSLSFGWMNIRGDYEKNLMQARDKRIKKYQ